MRSAVSPKRGPQQQSRQSSPSSSAGSAYAALATFIKEMFGQASTLTLQRPLIKMVGGDHVAALILSQVVYWSEHTSNPDGWFYKTYTEWEDELCVTRFQVDRAMKILPAFGVERDVRPVPGRRGSPTAHYRINREVLNRRIIEYAQGLGATTPSGPGGQGRRKAETRKSRQRSQEEARGESQEEAQSTGQSEVGKEAPNCKELATQDGDLNCEKLTTQAVSFLQLKVRETDNSSLASITTSITAAAETATVVRSAGFGPPIAAAAADPARRIPSPAEAAPVLLLDMTEQQVAALQHEVLVERFVREHPEYAEFVNEKKQKAESFSSRFSYARRPIITELLPRLRTQRNAPTIGQPLPTVRPAARPAPPLSQARRGKEVVAPRPNKEALAL